jgi:hypothetical protein
MSLDFALKPGGKQKGRSKMSKMKHVRLVRAGSIVQPGQGRSVIRKKTAKMCPLIGTERRCNNTMISQRLIIMATNFRTLMWTPVASMSGSIALRSKCFMSKPAVMRSSGLSLHLNKSLGLQPPIPSQDASEMIRAIGSLLMR